MSGATKFRIWMNAFGEMCKARYSENASSLKQQKSENYIAKLRHMRRSYNAHHTPVCSTCMAKTCRYAVVYRWLTTHIIIQMHSRTWTWNKFHRWRYCLVGFVFVLCEWDDWHQDLIPTRHSAHHQIAPPHCILVLLRIILEETRRE